MTALLPDLRAVTYVAVILVVTTGCLAGSAAAQVAVPVSQYAASSGPAATPAKKAELSPSAAVVSTGFRARQLDFPRVRSAFTAKAKKVAEAFRAAGITGPSEVLFRVFKREMVLEVWAREQGASRYTLVKSYPVCEVSGRPGPKRRRGDRQIPEGFYELDLFNPWSSYHLSMRVSYPNEVDRARGLGSSAPLGGDIYVHGGCATIGCVPVTDTNIEELYVIAVEARERGQRRIPIHIFPTRLDTAGMRWLARTYGEDFVDFPFWTNLKQGFDRFEQTRTLPRVGANQARYTFGPQ